MVLLSSSGPYGMPLFSMGCTVWHQVPHDITVGRWGRSSSSLSHTVVAGLLGTLTAATRRAPSLGMSTLPVGAEQDCVLSGLRCSRSPAHGPRAGICGVRWLVANSTDARSALPLRNRLLRVLWSDTCQRRIPVPPGRPPPPHYRVRVPAYFPPHHEHSLLRFAGESPS